MSEEFICWCIYSCHQSITHLSSKSCKRSDHKRVLSSFQLHVSQSKFHTKALLKPFSEAHAPQAQQLHVPAPHQQTIHRLLYSHSCNKHTRTPFLKHLLSKLEHSFSCLTSNRSHYSIVLWHPPTIFPSYSVKWTNCKSLTTNLHHIGVPKTHLISTDGQRLEHICGQRGKNHLKWRKSALDSARDIERTLMIVFVASSCRCWISFSLST
jgi:hypothetical protein